MGLKSADHYEIHKLLGSKGGVTSRDAATMRTSVAAAS